MSEDSVAAYMAIATVGAMVLGGLLSTGPSTSQRNQVEYRTVNYDSCTFLDGVNAGFSFGLALIEPHTRRCVLEHQDSGNFVHPDGNSICRIVLQDKQIRNYSCPGDVYRQL